jgi:hypothetical protein
MRAVGTFETCVPIYTATESSKQLMLVGLPLDVYGRVIAGSLGSPTCVSVLPLARSWWDRDIASRMRCHGDGKLLNSLPVCYTSPQSLSLLLLLCLTHWLPAFFIVPFVLPGDITIRGDKNYIWSPKYRYCVSCKSGWNYGLKPYVITAPYFTFICWYSGREICNVQMVRKYSYFVEGKFSILRLRNALNESHFEPVPTFYALPVAARS